MTVVVIAVPDIPKYQAGDKTMMVTVYEDGDEQPSETFSCLEQAETWVHSRWPAIKEHHQSVPPEALDGQYHDDPEVRWVGRV